MVGKKHENSAKALKKRLFVGEMPEFGKKFAK